MTLLRRQRSKCSELQPRLSSANCTNRKDWIAAESLHLLWRHVRRSYTCTLRWQVWTRSAISRMWSFRLCPLSSCDQWITRLVYV